MLEIRRWRRSLCARVNVSAKVRAAALGSRYFWARASAVSWFDATPVANDILTMPPRATRTRCRRLTIGSSVAPVVPVSDRPSIAWGRSGPRPRPRKRARSVSHSTGPWARPSRLITCTAHTSSSSGPRGRRRQRSAPHSGRYSASTNSFPNAGWATSEAGVASTISA